jgi:acyl-CoA synthetase (AMP-forming)/AMP-acid ligase II
MTLLQPELLAHLAEVFPDEVAWKNLGDGTDLSLSQWHHRSNRLARGLRGRGVRPGDRVALAITAERPFEWLISYVAIHRAGGVAVPLNTRLSGPELTAILEHAAVKGLLASDSVLAAHPGLLSGIDVVATVGSAGAADLAWSDLLDSDLSDLDHRIGDDDVADIMYTSGTTGAPKGVLVRHSGLSSSDRVPSNWLGLGFITSSPFSTTSGSLLICGPMRGGLSGWFLPRFDSRRWLREVESARPVAAFLVPAMVQLIVADPHFDTADLSSLAVVNIGSAPIATETLRQFGTRLPNADVMNGYGMTEFGAVAATPIGDGGTHAGSVGRPLPGVAVRIIGPDGSELPAGELGQITVQDSRHRRSYFHDPEASSQTWSGGWLLSGDLGYLDSDGFLWVAGRQKEIIIRGGHNIVPGEVEAVLFEHPDVTDAAVAGIPHPVLGEDVAAWLVTRPERAPSIEAIRSFLLDRLADYKVPRRITVVETLPRNEAGKVLKSRLVSETQQRSSS